MRVLLEEVFSQEKNVKSALGISRQKTHFFLYPTKKNQKEPNP